jgi:hypothetical protein
MWKPSKAQQRRIGKLGRLISYPHPEPEHTFAEHFRRFLIAPPDRTLSWLEEVWRVERHANGGRETYRLPNVTGDLADRRLRESYENTIARLEDLLSPEQLTTSLSDMFLFPAFSGLRAGGPEGTRFKVLSTIICIVAIRRMIESPCSYSVRLLGERIRYILSHPVDEAEIGPASISPRELYHYPRLDDCVDLLLKLRSHPDATVFLQDVVTGGFESAGFSPPVHLAEYLPPGETFTSYRVYRTELERYWFEAMEVLYDAGKLDYATFSAAARRLGPIESAQKEWLDEPGQSGEASSFETRFRGYCDRLAWELASELKDGRHDNARLLTVLPHRRGVRYLVLACEILDKKARGDLLATNADLERAVMLMAGRARLQADDDRASALKALRGYRGSALAAVLPATGGQEEALLLEALEWQRAAPLVAFFRIGEPDPHMMMETQPYGSFDPSSVVDRDKIVRLVEQAGGERVRQVIGAFRAAGEGREDHLLQVEAAMGWNRSFFDDGLRERNLTAVSACGLLPLAGQEVTRYRYAVLKDFARAVWKSTPERQSLERTAVRVALTHLALQSGYPDATRLEMDVEAAIVNESVEGPQWFVDEYGLEIWMDASQVWLQATRQGEPLGSIPDIVRENEVQAEAEATRKELEAQQNRFRARLEESMATSESLTSKVLERWSRLRLMRVLLSSLLFRSTSGAVGLLEFEPLGLRLVDGSFEPLSEATFVAHPYHLQRARSLTGWQKSIFHRHLVQPFKQAFRELYKIAPAEKKATASERFAGVSIDFVAAERLFRSRGWRLKASPAGFFAVRRFPKAGVQAACQFHTMSSEATATSRVTTGTLSFHAGSSNGEKDELQQPLSLAEVPPSLFSEAMRDLDGIVPTTSRQGKAPVSDETCQRRAQFLRCLFADLGLTERTRVEGRSAFIQGRLARYQVDIGNGDVHLPADEKPCALPEGWPKERDRLFVPFPEKEDPKLVELVSRVIKLSNDDLIEDEVILEQILSTG